MKVVERIFKHRIRQQIEIDDMQFGLMKGKTEPPMPFLWQDRCRRILELKVRSSILVLWKDNVESKGVRVNMNKTMVMTSGKRQKVRQKAVRWPCGVCSKGVGINSSQCTSCQKWVHKKCSGIKCQKWQSHSFVEAA